MKRCRRCHIEKPATEFYNLKRNSDGLHSYCKQCCRDLSREYREDNPDKIKDRNHKWYVGNREYAITKAKEWTDRNPDKSKEIWKRSARRRRQNGTMRKYHVDLADVLDKWGTVCYICGIEIDMLAPRSCAQSGWERGLHIDHVVPRVLGGQDDIENLRPTHGFCNLKKRDKEIDTNA